jgi:sigma-B regulation protein RsbU (phosphoserine phosphatase)
VGVIIAEGEDGRLAQSNPAADKLLGRAAPLGAAIDQYSSECGLFKPTGEPYPTRELPLSRAIIEGRLIADQEVVVERPDGSRITVLTTASPIKDERGRVTRAVLVFQDISERKRAEERQRTIAEVLQDSLMPELPAEVGGLKVASKYVAALEEARVGGDFIDVFDISSSRVAVVVGDVSGKGLSAAVEVAMTKYYIRSYCYAHPESPGEVLARVNGAMLHHVDDERFVTAFLAIFDTDTFTLSYASAGHEPGLVRRAQDNTLEELRPTGMALGVTLGFQHEQKSIELQPEDLLILYTDGATEARSPDGEMLTFEGLKHIISKSAKAGAQDTCDSTFLAIREYTAGRLRDDLALLVVGAC